MKFSAADFPRIQFSLLAAALSIGIGVASVYFSLSANNATQRERQTAQTERNEFDGKLKRVRNEENEIKQKSALFNNLRTRGVIGDEQRLEWIELLKSIRDQRRLIDLQYEIEPQRPLFPPPASDLAFYGSTMRIQLKLLHEEDLTRLINDLRQQAKALIQTKSCKISRLPRGSAEGATSAQLQADCRIDWLTVHQPVSP